MFEESEDDTEEFGDPYDSDVSDHDDFLRPREN